MSKTILITGSSRGIGKAIAELAHKKGYKVIVHGRTDSEQLQAVHQQLEGSIKTFFDVADKEATHQAINKVIEEVGVIDALVNNTGIGQSGLKNINEIDDGKALEEYRVNVLGSIHCVQSVLPKMLEQQNGSIVNIASVKGQYNLTSMSSLTYGTTKAGVIALTKALAKVYGDKGVRFNSVSPGYVQTDMAKDWNQQTFDRINNGTILGRISQPSEIASAVMFLISEEASYITGTDLLADGGFTLKGK